MERFGISIMTVPTSDTPNSQTLWVNLHVHNGSDKTRIVSLVEFDHVVIPDRAQGSGFEWAVEVADLVYQALTKGYAAHVKTLSNGETNARPGDTSVPS